MRPALRRWHDLWNAETDASILKALQAEQHPTDVVVVMRFTGYTRARVINSLDRLERQGKIRSSLETLKPNAQRSPRLLYEAVDGFASGRDSVFEILP